VALHGEQKAVRIHIDVRGRHQTSERRQFRLSDGVDDARLRRPARLQPDADWRSSRFERLRHRHAERFHILFIFIVIVVALLHY